MKLIDKFKNLHLNCLRLNCSHKEDKLLSYLMPVANHFFPDPDGWDSRFIWSFKHYYNGGKFFHLFTPEQYHERFHEELESYNIDVEKFWYLFICIYDYCYSTYKVGKKLEKTSAKEEFDNAMEYLKSNFLSFGDCFFSHRKLSVTIKREGKRAITISHIEAIRKLINWDAEYIETDLDGRCVVPDTALVDKGENIFAFHFDKYMNWFLSENFKNIPFKTKIYFIEDLLVFSGVIKEEKLIPEKKTDNNYDKADWLKGIRHRYKESGNDVISSTFNSL